VQIAVGSADGYPAVWRQAAGAGSWTLVSSLSVASGYPGRSALTSVTHGPAGWLAVGSGPSPVVLTSADGTTWQRAGVITADLAGASGLTTAANQSGYVIVANPAGGAAAMDLWWSSNLTSWTSGADMNDTTGPSHISAVTVNSHEFMAVGSHNGQPRSGRRPTARRGPRSCWVSRRERRPRSCNRWRSARTTWSPWVS
jgi:hypothetical protein